MRGFIYVASVIAAAALSGHAYKTQRATPPAQPVAAPASTPVAPPRARPMGMQKDRPRPQGMRGMGMGMDRPAGMGVAGKQNSIAQSKKGATIDCGHVRREYNRIMALPIGERLAAASRAAAGSTAEQRAAARRCLGM